MFFKSVLSSHSKNTEPATIDHVNSSKMRNQTPLLFLHAGTHKIFLFFRSQIDQCFKVYAAFKVRKLIHFCKEIPLALDHRQSKYSLLLYDIHIFSNLGMAFVVPCSWFRFLCKKIENIFALLYFYLYEFSVSQIFKILFQTRDTNIFVLCDVFFSRYDQMKSSFSDKKYISSET